MDENWYKAKEEWCDPDRPFDPSWNVPPKQSVDFPEWKKRVIWGDNWQEPNNDPTQPDHYATTDWTSHTDRGKQNGW